MNKRISDEELEKALKRVREEKCAVMIFDTDIAEKFVADLIDAREAVKNYESMIITKRPSLAEHLQKLANKHKVGFCVSKTDISYFNRGYSAPNAEAFFNFNRCCFIDDCTGSYIKPDEADDE